MELARPAPPGLLRGRDRVAQALARDRLRGDNSGGGAGRHRLEQLLVLLVERRPALGLPVHEGDDAERLAAEREWREHRGRLVQAERGLVRALRPAAGNDEARQRPFHRQARAGVPGLGRRHRDQLVALA